MQDKPRKNPARPVGVTVRSSPTRCDVSVEIVWTSNHRTEIVQAFAPTSSEAASLAIREVDALASEARWAVRSVFGPLAPAEAPAPPLASALAERELEVKCGKCGLGRDYSAHAIPIPKGYEYAAHKFVEPSISNGLDAIGEAKRRARLERASLTDVTPAELRRRILLARTPTIASEDALTVAKLHDLVQEHLQAIADVRSQGGEVRATPAALARRRDAEHALMVAAFGEPAK